MPEFLLKTGDDPRSLLERWGRSTTEIPEDWKEIVPETVGTIDSGVDLLRNPLAVHHKGINKLMANLWRIVGNKIVPFAVTDSLPFGYKGLLFWAEAGSKGGRAAILVPVNWIEQVRQDRWLQMGGLVFVASQANDFWQGRLGIPGASKTVERRCRAWESEFLHYLSRRPESGFSPNTYQRKIMEAHPDGLASLPADLGYELSPYVSEDFDLIDGALPDGPPH